MKVREVIADMSMNTPEDYQEKINELLGRRDFDGLENTAATARSTKARFPGGAWKLLFFYEALSQPSDGRQASSTEWSSQIAVLRQWAFHQPQSSTARIALAQAYLNYGNKARGSGSADTVTGEGWQALGENAGLALAALKEAATLPVRCPYWYAAMVQVARQQGWSQARTRTLVDESVSFAPDFYHVYRYYADYLQPKWYGNEGDAEAFADGISRRIGGEEGAFVYFEIATVLNCGPCGGSYDSVQLSWPKIKQGYVALQHLYGTSNLKMNRFALMATKVGDKSAAKETFAAIGERWDEEVWRSKQTFEAARTWAMN